MNYQRIYDQLIDRAKNELRIKSKDVYYEKHHIIPKCLGGTNDKDNLVLLTAKEHFIAHKLLCEIYLTNSKLHYALWRMMNLQNHDHKRNYNIGSIEYTRRKLIHQQLTRSLGISNKGRLVADDIKQKIREKRKLQLITNETKQKISNSLKGRKKSPRTLEHKEKIRQSMLGKNKGKPKPNRTIEHRTNLSLAHKNRIKINCPHCSCNSTNKSNMIRYHFDNCKNKNIS